MKVRIRQATAHDLSAIIVLLEEMREESALAYPPIHYGKLVAVLNDTMSNYLCAVAEDDDGGIVGCAGATIMEWFFSHGARVGDVFFYVAPGARASNAAAKLMKCLMKYAEEKELPLITGPTDGNDLDRKEQFYERFGLQKFGALFATNRMFKEVFVKEIG